MAFELTDHIATKDEINQECDRSQRVVVLTEASQLTEADSEKIFMLNAAAEFETKLPAIKDAGAGWSCKFVVQVAPAGANYTIVEDVAYDTNVIVVNGINELEVDTGDDGVYSAGCTTLSLVAAKAVAGDWIEIFCDGTNYFATGQANKDDAVTAA